MQAIARVNRVFRDKPAGLVVDYIGIAQNLKSALGQYSPGDREQTGIDEAQAVRVLMEKYEIVRAIFRPDTKGGFDYRPALDARSHATVTLGDHGGCHRLGADGPAGGRRPRRPPRTARSAPTAAIADAVAGAVEGIRIGGGERRCTQIFAMRSHFFRRSARHWSRACPAMEKVAPPTGNLRFSRS